MGPKWTEINNRLFIDAVFPDPDYRDKVRMDVARYAEAIGVSMRSMIDQLTWMTTDSKKAIYYMYKSVPIVFFQGAYNKLDLFVRNILYPNDTLDDTYLDDYYKDLDWDPNAPPTFIDMQLKMGPFMQGKELAQLNVMTGVDRSEFDDTSQVNAFYRPDVNSITICAGITNPPFYHYDWPASVNYGGIGMVVGRVVTGFSRPTNSREYYNSGYRSRNNAWLR